MSRVDYFTSGNEYMYFFLSYPDNTHRLLYQKRKGNIFYTIKKMEEIIITPYSFSYLEKKKSFVPR